MPHGSLPWQTMFEAVGTTACGALELAPPPRDGAFHDAVLLTFSGAGIGSYPCHKADTPLRRVQFLPGHDARQTTIGRSES